MTIYVSEFHNTNSRLDRLLHQPITSYALSSASTSVLPNAQTDYLRVSADVGSFIGFSTSTVAGSPTLTSTNAHRIAPNFDTYIAVPVQTPALRILAQST
jgi:hypothetical protein